MITLFDDKRNCCACGACLNICPKQAITMKEDEYGFYYPEIDNEKCVQCGLCKKVCAYQSEENTNEPMCSYVAQSQNQLISKSASGGIFATIATNVINNNGVVYGVALEYIDERLVSKHISIERLEDLIKLQGSKYVQSSTGETFKAVKNDLLNGKTVLYSGTPCQIAGLKSYLNKDYENLFCIDIICHGTPGNRFFQDYITTLERKYNDKVVDFKFRDKVGGWGLTANAYTANAYTANAGNKIFPCEESSYYMYFLKSYTYRINCYSCKYANQHRSGDITIGDYWGVQVEHPEYFIDNGGDINPKLGVSCIIVNNSRGNELLEKYANNIKLKNTTFDKIAKHNDQLRRTCDFNPKKRLEILEAYRNYGYDAVEKIYGNDVKVDKLKRNIKMIIKKTLPNFIVEKLKEARDKYRNRK